ncbi:unnamed protein product [Euphydryas editha]|uniref:RNA-directed DNA polymerase n=1 Tax=Euphydryas editha TaxID=104508 RepID=A0AAU9V6D1_EUPED|nr:unnamed protein product [Euphydryas editha]
MEANRNFIGNLPLFDNNEQSFESWLELFEEYCTLNNVPKESATSKVRKSLFLCHIGVKHYNMLHSICLPSKPNEKSIEELAKILKEKYDSPGLESTNRYLFYRRMQSELESGTEYIAALQQVASKCNFGTHAENACRDQLICGIRDENIRKKLLSVTNLNYERAKTIFLQEESVVNQLKNMNSGITSHSTINKVRKFTNQGHSRQNSIYRQKSVNPHKQVSRQGPVSQHNSNSRQYAVGQSQVSQRGKFCSQNSVSKQCYRCGRYHNPMSCPARSWKCYVCQHFGHTSKMCRSLTQGNTNQVNEVSNVSDNSVDEVVNQLTESLYVNNVNVTCKFQYHKQMCVCISCDSPCDSNCGFCTNINLINVNNVSSKPQVIKVNIEGSLLDMEIDTGAAISLIPYQCYINLFKNHVLHPCNIKLNTVSCPLYVAGVIKVMVSYNNSMSNRLLSLVVSQSDKQSFIPLLGRDWLDILNPEWRNNILSINSNNICVKSIQPEKIDNMESTVVQQFIKKYPNVFSKNIESHIIGFEAKLVLKENSTPVFLKPYPLPYNIINVVSDALDKLEREGKIYKVNYSEWASPLVPIKKVNGQYRICVDFKRSVNQNIKVDSYPLPKPEDVFATMAGGEVFVVLDLSDAYTQLLVEEKSQELLTVNTHKGLYRYRRLIYGIASAPAIFQKVMDQLLSDIPNTVCYIDDILIKGNNFSDCYETTVKVLKKLNEHNIRINYEKCKWFAKSVEYLGHLISKEGRKPSPSLVEAIVNAKCPQNVKELRSYLGMLNFYHNFIGNLSTLVKPLRRLTEHTVKWNWTPECQSAFTISKQKLISSDILVHYNPSLPLVVYTDASPVGLGAVLCHVLNINGKSVEKPIAYASCSLTKVQCNYSQLDREALGVIYAVTKFHKYLWGRHFTLITDNAPIKHILHPSKGIPTLAAQRLQHWALILESYDYNIEHRKSEFLQPADTLSRLPINNIVLDINSNVSTNELPINMFDIAQHTLYDSVLAKVTKFTKEGWPHYCKDPAISPYFKIRNYVSINENCLMFGSRLIVPQKCQQQVLNLLHEGHPGIVRSKMLARSLFWWPSMSLDIETKCQSCESCSVVNFKPSQEKRPWPKTSMPFERVHIDFFEFKKHHFLIYCDTYSKWLDIKHMKSCNADNVIEELCGIFSYVGLPVEIVSDNGPPFDSYRFINFCTKFNIKITKSPAYHPESNGFAERNVQIAKKALSKLVLDKNKCDSLNLKIHTFLLNYRNTPTTTTEKCPNSLLFLYQHRTLLSMLNPNFNPKSVKKYPFSHMFFESLNTCMQNLIAVRCDYFVLSRHYSRINGLLFLGFKSFNNTIWILFVWTREKVTRLYRKEYFKRLSKFKKFSETL